MELLGRHGLLHRHGGRRRTAFSLDDPPFMEVGHPVIVCCDVTGIRGDTGIDRRVPGATKHVSLGVQCA